MKCCEKEVTTPFCPMCGAEANNPPLATLREHCRKTLNKQTLLLEDMEEHYEKQKERMDDHEWAVASGRVERSRKNVNKWLAWDRLLIELLREG